MPTEPKPVKTLLVPIPIRKPEIDESVPDVVPEKCANACARPYPLAPEVISAIDDLNSPN